VANRQDFNDTSGLAFEWRLLVHGRPVLGAAKGDAEGWRRDATLVPLGQANAPAHSPSFLSSTTATTAPPSYAIPARGYGLLRLPLTPARLAALAVGAATAAAPPLLPGDAVVDVRCVAVGGSSSAWALDPKKGHVVARRQLPVTLSDLRLQLGVAEPHAAVLAAGGGGGAGAPAATTPITTTQQDPVAAWEAAAHPSSPREDDNPTTVIVVEKQPDGGVVVELPRREHGGEAASASAPLFRARVGGSTGCLEELWSCHDDGNPTPTNLLATPLTPCLFRAATDNDRGGSGGASHAARWAAAGLDRLAVVPADGGREELARLFEGLGKDDEGFSGWEDVRRPEVEVVSSATAAEGERSADASAVDASVVVVRASFEMRPRRPAEGSSSAAAAAAGAGVSEVGGAHWFAGDKEEEEEEEKRGGGDADADAARDASAPSSSSSPLALVRVSVEYELRPRSGLVLTRWDVDASRALPARPPQGLPRSLPRVGLHAAVLALGGGGGSSSSSSRPPPPPPNPDPRSREERAASALARVRWFGRGPHECYPDRKYGALLGVYER
jgi:beta-galactosidase